MFARRRLLNSPIEEFDEQTDDIPDYDNLEDSSDDEIEYTDQQRKTKHSVIFSWDHWMPFLEARFNFCVYWTFLCHVEVEYINI